MSKRAKRATKKQRKQSAPIMATVRGDGSTRRNYLQGRSDEVLDMLRRELGKPGESFDEFLSRTGASVHHDDEKMSLLFSGDSPEHEKMTALLDKIERQGEPAKAKNTIDPALDCYTRSMRAAFRAARGEGWRFQGIEAGKLSERSIREGRLVWAWLRNARIIDVGDETYVSLFEAIDRYTTEKIAKLKHNDVQHEDEGEQHFRRVTEAGRTVPFPDELPFGNCFFTFGRGVALSESGFIVRTRLTNQKFPPGLGGVVLGILVTEGGVVEFMDLFDVETGEHVGMMWAINYLTEGIGIAEYDGLVGTWAMNCAYALNPWIVNALVSLVREQRTFIGKRALDPLQRKRFQRAGPSMGIKRPLPQPYYLVRLKHRAILDSFEREKKRIRKHAFQFSHRFDRSGHEVVIVRRGPLPMSAKDRAYFEQRAKRTKGEQRIYTIDTPTAEDYQRLMARGIEPKRTDEWMVVLVTWKDATVVGDEKLPYVPALRRLPGDRPRAAVTR